MIKIGIVGLPNVGKSTLFQALTQKQVQIANYPFTTIDPNVGIVNVPDENLAKLVKLLKPQRHFPAVIEFVDIAGLVKGAHQGHGLGNQFLSHIYGVDAILFLIRCFKDSNVSSVTDNPQEQLDILKEELRQKDEEVKNKDSSAPKLNLKPRLHVCNIKEADVDKNAPFEQCDLKLDAKLELEISQLSAEAAQELKLQSRLPRLVELAYQTLGLITFYTVKGGQEIRAWPVKKGILAPQAGGVVHSDFEKMFIRTEVIRWQKLLEAGSWPAARKNGWLKTEGRDYEIQDGDVVEFKI